MERAMSYFNEEQRDYARYLASIPIDQLCWCGWGRVGHLGAPFGCPPDATLADRNATAQPCCGRPASHPVAPRTSGSHYAGCRSEHRDPFLIELGLVDLGGEG